MPHLQIPSAPDSVPIPWPVPGTTPGPGDDSHVGGIGPLGPRVGIGLGPVDSGFGMGMLRRSDDKEVFFRKNHKEVTLSGASPR